MAEQDLLITGAYVVTLDPGSDDLPVGDVLIRDGRIARIGSSLTEYASGARRIEADGRLVIPGMIDTHRHMWQGALASMFRDLVVGLSAAVFVC